MPVHAPSTPKSGLLLWGVCLVTATAAALWVARREPLRRQPGENSSSSLAVAASIRALETRIAELEARMQTLSTPALLPAPAAEEPRARVSEDASFDLEELSGFAERLARLEARQAGLQQIRPADPGLGRPWTRRGEIQVRAVSAAEQRDELHALVLDPNASDSDRAHAWLDLLQVEAEPWTDQVVMEAVHIGATSEDDRAREVIWIGADTHHRNDLLVQPLIQALSDPVENVREEAADALGRYLDVPGVRAALLFTSRNDASEKVREEAQRVLDEGG